jgi:glucoamylase
MLPMLSAGQHFRDLYRTSLTVLKVHESIGFPGGLIASLSVPFGTINGDSDMGGYHLVWPRDMVEAAGALLAAGGHDDVRRMTSFLQVTQNPDGHWPQNMWARGKPYLTGVQMDETALVVLLIDLARSNGALDSAGVSRFWPMVRRAAGFIVRQGPVTNEDRWEEQPGYSVSTIPIEIAALLAAADLAELNSEADTASYLRKTADAWYESLDDWLFAEDTELARRLGVKGYYVRVAPAPEDPAASPLQGQIKLGNTLSGGSLPAVSMVSPDALMLVRFGVRAPDDPRILDTVHVIDALLKVETPHGPAWHRYNHDGYGEHADGSPFDGKGIGRAWPLLTGERAHYELAAGHFDEARRLMRAMESFANQGGLLPEQVWDSNDFPERGLFFGRPSGSADPLVWAHAEYVKLRRSIREGHVFDKPPQARQRYLVEKRRSEFATWRFTCRPCVVSTGKNLRLELLEPARVHWGTDGWHDAQDTDTKDSGLGVHVADIPTSRFPAGRTVNFTFYWVLSQRWEGRDFAVVFRAAEGGKSSPSVSGGDIKGSFRPARSRARW